MGCDIHMVLERKFEDKWVGVHTFDSRPIKYAGPTREIIADYNSSRGDKPYADLPAYHWWDVRSRNYDLFGALANVRRDVPGAPDPRGVPDDASDLARMAIEGWGADGHSHTYWPLDEALPVFGAHICPEHVLGNDRQANLAQKLFELDFGDGDAASDYRLIIWFDN